jgi:hypothetical protein
MKNVISKTKYVLMALIMVAAFSCSPEDGTDGAQGATGPAGQDGTNGQDGEDGNANVLAVTFASPAWNGSNISLTVPEITQDVFDNGAVLGYVKFANINSIFYPVPGGVFPSIPSFVIRTFIEVGAYELRAVEWDGTTHGTPENIEEVKLIIIESSSTIAKSSKINVQDQLKNAGVDINNYNEVMDYYGLDY